MLFLDFVLGSITGCETCWWIVACAFGVRGSRGRFPDAVHAFKAPLAAPPRYPCTSLLTDLKVLRSMRSAAQLRRYKRWCALRRRIDGAYGRQGKFIADFACLAGPPHCDATQLARTCKPKVTIVSSVCREGAVAMLGSNGLLRHAHIARFELVVAQRSHRVARSAFASDARTRERLTARI